MRATDSIAIAATAAPVVQIDIRHVIVGIVVIDTYRVTFKFFCVVYGFLLVVHLVRIAIAQNISIARAD